MNTAYRAFSLIEIMIVVAIIGILSAVAIPSYHQYTRKARYSELVQAAAPYKIGVTLCYQATDDITQCDAGRQGVPNNVSSGSHSGLVDSIRVHNGAITITPQKKYGINKQDTYVLKPIIKKHQLSWEVSGGAILAGYVS